MKDYTNGKDENFILNYNESGNNLIVNFAHKLFKKKQLIVDNTETNKNKILDTMTKQVSIADRENKEKQIEQFKPTTVILSALSLAMIFTIMLFGEITLWFTIPVLVFSLYFTAKNIKNYIVAKDAIKSLDFIANQEKLNNVIEKQKDFILNNTTKKVQKIISESTKNPTFDINIIDKLSYNELKELLQIIKTNEYFEFEQVDRKQEQDKRIKLENK